jgi:hypothetical protein
MVRTALVQVIVEGHDQAQCYTPQHERHAFHAVTDALVQHHDQCVTPWSESVRPAMAPLFA